MINDQYRKNPFKCVKFTFEHNLHEFKEEFNFNDSYIVGFNPLESINIIRIQKKEEYSLIQHVLKS